MHFVTLDRLFEVYFHLTYPAKFKQHTYFALSEVHGYQDCYLQVFWHLQAATKINQNKFVNLISIFSLLRT